MHVPFTNLARAVDGIRAELDVAIARVLDSGYFILGSEVQAFERQFAAACGSAHAVGLASGTDAIEVALRALGIGPGDDVVTQANTCVPTIAGIVRAGASPVLCDVDSASGTMDPDSLRLAITPKTRAVVPVHLYGQCADMAAVGEVCAQAEVAIVEDCAQAFGATIAGVKAGTLGSFGAFSFYPTKNLAALGDAGAVVTDDDQLAERARRVRSYGQVDRYRHVEQGVNSRLDELQAAILSIRLARAQRGVERRRQIAAAYDDALQDTPVVPLARLRNREHAFHLYVLRAPNRDALSDALADRGVETLIHYPTPIHRHPPFLALGQTDVPLDRCERLADEILSLPMYPELSDAEVEVVADAVRSASSA